MENVKLIFCKFDCQILPKFVFNRKNYLGNISRIYICNIKYILMKEIYMYKCMQSYFNMYFLKNISMRYNIPSCDH